MEMAREYQVDAVTNNKAQGGHYEAHAIPGESRKAQIRM
jgi:hypothetical protein